jgi:hypothetical protein
MGGLARQPTLIVTTQLHCVKIMHFQSFKNDGFWPKKSPPYHILPLFPAVSSPFLTRMENVETCFQIGFHEFRRCTFTIYDEQWRTVVVGF